uniref:Putative secreted protein n=1 Tax=Anopheles darlingi TaxID=43151 RepID=A0A2M4DJG6_ANODA
MLSRSRNPTKTVLRMERLRTIISIMVSLVMVPVVVPAAELVGLLEDGNELWFHQRLHNTTTITIITIRRPRLGDYR